MKATLATSLFIAVLSGSAVSQQNLLMKTNNNPMENKDFTTFILVNQTPAEAFQAITNFRGWWSEEIEGTTDQLNETFFYHYKDVHLCKVKLIELVPNQKLVYHVIDNEFNFTKDKTEWINTYLVFDVSTDGKQTKVTFTHQGLVPSYECYLVCQDAWTSYIQGSLQSLITTGKGKPNPKEGGLNEELVKKWGLPTKHIISMELPKQKDYSTSIWVQQSPAEVFKAINNPRGWWQGEISGKTDQLNEVFTYQMDDVHFSRQQIVELVNDQKVVWLVTESNLSFVAKRDEWTNTKIQFDIKVEDGKTKVTFTHFGLVPAFECYNGCSGAWGLLIEKSLFNFITNGKGVKVF